MNSRPLRRRRGRARTARRAAEPRAASCPSPLGAASADPAWLTRCSSSQEANVPPSGSLRDSQRGRRIDLPAPHVDERQRRVAAHAEQQRDRVSGRDQSVRQVGTAARAQHVPVPALRVGRVRARTTCCSTIPAAKLPMRTLPVAVADVVRPGRRSRARRSSGRCDRCASQQQKRCCRRCDGVRIS